MPEPFEVSVLHQRAYAGDVLAAHELLLGRPLESAEQLEEVLLNGPSIAEYLRALLETPEALGRFRAAAEYAFYTRDRRGEALSGAVESEDLRSSLRRMEANRSAESGLVEFTDAELAGAYRDASLLHRYISHDAVRSDMKLLHVGTDGRQAGYWSPIVGDYSLAPLLTSELASVDAASGNANRSLLAALTDPLWDEGTFDGIVCEFTLQRLPRRAQAELLAWLAVRLNPSGWLCLQFATHMEAVQRDLVGPPEQVLPDSLPLADAICLTSDLGLKPVRIEADGRFGRSGSSATALFLRST